MAGIQGAVSEYKGGSQVLGTGRLRESYSDGVDYLDTDKNLLDRLLRAMGKESVRRMEHKWLTQKRKKDFVAFSAYGGSWASGAAASGSFTVAAADAFLFAVGDLVKNIAHSDTRMYYVTAVNLSTGVISASTVDTTTVNLSAAAVGYLFRVSNSFEVGSGKGTIKSEQPTESSNYIQILQTTIGITTTAMQLDYRGNYKEWDKLRFEAGVDHMFSKEKTFFFGKKYRDATGRMDAIYEQFYAGGLTEFISTNITDAGGALTQAEFKSFLTASTKYADMPTVFAGELIYEALTQWAETKLELVRSEKTLGMAVANYVTPYGNNVAVIPHRELLKQDATGYAFCTDIKDLKYLYLEGMDDHLEVDIQQPDLKQKIDEWRTWFSLKVGNEQRHGMLKNVTSISNS